MRLGRGLGLFLEEANAGPAVLLPLPPESALFKSESQKMEECTSRGMSGFREGEETSSQHNQAHRGQRGF